MIIIINFPNNIKYNLIDPENSDSIGLNPFMARACAMYHDIGKIKNPEYFIENQQGGYNPSAVGNSFPPSGDSVF